MKIGHIVLSSALLALAASPLAASAEKLNGYGGGNANAISGIVSSVNGGAITLRNGRTIFLQNGTVIAPNGQSIQAGERISASGWSAGNGNLNARSISINGYGSNVGPNGYRNGYGRRGRANRDRREHHNDRQNGAGNDRDGDGNNGRGNDQNGH